MEVDSSLPSERCSHPQPDYSVAREAASYSRGQWSRILIAGLLT